MEHEKSRGLMFVCVGESVTRRIWLILSSGFTINFDMRRNVSADEKV